MAPHSSTLAWKIPLAEEPGRLQSMGSRRVGHDCYKGFPSGSDGKESAYNVGDPGSIPGLERPPGEGNGNPLQYSCLENPIGRGAWSAAVHGVAKSQTRLSDFTFTVHLQELEKEMATHSSVLAWRIPGMGQPSGLPSMGLHRVGHD